MVKDAETFAAKDAEKKEEVETINHADSLVYTTEKSLRDYGDKISQSERADIEARVNALRQAVNDKNIQGIKRKMDELTQASHKLAEAIYRQASQQQTSQEKAGAAPKEGVIDAEYEEAGPR
jgi:molecular chaperone DnaK